MHVGCFCDALLFVARQHTLLLSSALLLLSSVALASCSHPCKACTNIPQYSVPVCVADLLSPDEAVASIINGMAVAPPQYHPLNVHEQFAVTVSAFRKGLLSGWRCRVTGWQSLHIVASTAAAAAQQAMSCSCQRCLWGRNCNCNGICFTLHAQRPTAGTGHHQDCGSIYCLVASCYVGEMACRNKPGLLQALCLQN